MNELYWITRLDTLCGILQAVAIIAGLLTAASVIVCIVAKTYAKIGYSESCREDNREIYGVWKPIRNWAAVFFALSLPLCILTPNAKEAMLIWGVGSTIDYLKGNNTVQQLPDKCVDALNRWVDSLNKEDSK